ncbi:MAG: SurA N-terminal domain-containing protein [Deltaproteobacteria bacterium]|nr:SurA N-terminal domain-containing protein [Deltaproteobacteria bacterium]
MRFFLLLCLCLSLSSFPTSGARAERQLVDGIAAQVGNRVILFSDVVKLTGPSEVKMRESGASPAEILRFRGDVLERLIDRKLVEEVIERSDLTATEEEIDEAIEGIARQNNLTLDELKASVESEGLPYESYREELRGEIERARVMNTRVRSRVSIEEEDVAALYEANFSNQPASGEELRLEQLLVPTSPERDLTSACDEIHQAREQVRQGASLASVAKSHPAARFTQLDWTHKSQLAEWMVGAVNSPESSSLGEVIRTEFGCVLLHVIERRHFEPVTFAQAEERLYEQLYDREMETAYREWLAELRKETYIEKKGIFAHRDAFVPGSAPGE